MGIIPVKVESGLTGIIGSYRFIRNAETAKFWMKSVKTFSSFVLGHKTKTEHADDRRNIKKVVK